MTRDEIHDRDETIARLHESGRTVRDLAMRFGLSERHVKRIIATARRKVARAVQYLSVA